MVIKYFLELLKSYKFSIIKVIIFELFYILRGYKGNSFSVTKNIKINNNIPCPYFLLHKINNFIKKRNIKSFIDLGCGSGRSIYFFNKKYKIHYFGIEYIDETYKKCKKMFINDNNVQIINENFMNFNFLGIEADCFFINDPLKDRNELNKLINEIFKKNEILKKKIYLILANIEKNKLQFLNDYDLIEYLDFDTRGYYIYSNSGKINEA